MDYKEAIARAKAHLATVFADEGVADIRTEELATDRKDPPAWRITLSFIRPGEKAPAKDLAASQYPPYGRDLKVVVMDHTGKLVEIVDRFFVEA